MLNACSKNEEHGNTRQSSQPRTTRSQNVSNKVAVPWTLHAKGQQFREGPNGRHKQRLKKKRSPEEMLDGLHTGGRRHHLRGSCGLVQKLCHAAEYKVRYAQ